MTAEPAIKIICTIGPASKTADILNKFSVRNVFLARINLSHISEARIEEHVRFLSAFPIPVAIDTEGAQVRTGFFGKEPLSFALDDAVSIHGEKIRCNKNNIYLVPESVIQHVLPGDLIFLDFNSVLLKVEDVSMRATNCFVKCRVLIEGSVGSNKGVHCDGFMGKLPPFGKKDLTAVRCAKKYGVKHFTLSFMDDVSQVAQFKNLYPESVVYAKIETLKGVQNVSDILRAADGILIDRGDLSREIPIHKIPLTQKILIHKARSEKKEVFIASNLLETMANELKPSRAEANDIVSTVLDGVTGFVLTKETAVGEYPVETLNMLNALIRQGQLFLRHAARANSSAKGTVLRALKDSQYMENSQAGGFLIEPHGGRLVERSLTPEEDRSLDWEGMKKVVIEGNTLMDLEQIATGTYSPVGGFMCRQDYLSVLKNMRLKSGAVWTLPVMLTVSAAQRKNLKEGERVALVFKEDGKIYGFLDIEEIFPYDKKQFARVIYGTEDERHPGVKMAARGGDFIAGGRVALRERRKDGFFHYNLTPRQVRSIFESLGWSRVVGFHTRNVVHRSHEFIQMEALQKTGCDGLFIHPVAGAKKRGDFNSETIVKSYEVMLEKVYPKNKVVFALFSTYSRYAGPREAVFTALCRQNFGCSHFIVGRDHTGVHNYFSSKDSHAIFNEIGRIGIQPVFFDEAGYSPASRRYVYKSDKVKDYVSISGTRIRELLLRRKRPPDWAMRKEVSELLLKKMRQGKGIFV